MLSNHPTACKSLSPHNSCCLTTKHHCISTIPNGILQIADLVKDHGVRHTIIPVYGFTFKDRQVPSEGPEALEPCLSYPPGISGDYRDDIVYLDQFLIWCINQLFTNVLFFIMIHQVMANYFRRLSHGRGASARVGTGFSILRWECP